MIRLLLACYPARWRRRYGEEFADLLESRPIGPFDVADILLGAVDARLHVDRFGHDDPLATGPAMSQRLGGWAAIAGGLLWLAVFVGSATAAGHGGGVVAAVIVPAASVVVLVALAGLSAFQARSYPRLIWTAFAVPAIGSIASIAGLVIAAAAGDRPLAFGLTSWDLWFGGVLSMMAGSALFAAATWRVRSLSRGPAAILFAGSVAIVPAVVAMVASVPLVGELGLLVALLAFCGGWVGIGVSALRSRQPLPVTALVG